MATITTEDGTEMAGFDRLSQLARLSARYDEITNLDLHGLIILVLGRRPHLPALDMQFAPGCAQCMVRATVCLRLVPIPQKRRTLDAWSQQLPRLETRHCRTELHCSLWRRHRPRRIPAAGGLSGPRGEPSGDGDRRFHRPCDGNRQGRHCRAGHRVHRGALFHRRAAGQDRRPPVPHRTSDL